MTTTLLDQRIEVRTSDADGEIDHYFCCCTPNLALCGKDLSDEAVCPEGCSHDECKTCVDLIDITCMFCGCGLTGPCACGEFT